MSRDLKMERNAHAELQDKLRAQSKDYERLKVSPSRYFEYSMPIATDTLLSLARRRRSTTGTCAMR